ncbi:YceD family protein [Marinobacter sp. X15-166B]|uniref:YceD family protein n=1 Tax=Marinobacter sp. X15-166B TaxID=1897620 RepID=UPI00085C6EF2|nr:YceD family protein [Marinobacter sp. X15-166B]OEY67147.1 hypothetical protein BG841_12250 [Marinobacter sp. X15-166B]
MSNTELPKTVDPYRLAAQSVIVDGELPVHKMRRFYESILGAAEQESCQVRLSFYMDDMRRRLVSGELKTSVTLQCQRCLTPMTAELASSFTLGLVTTDEQAQNLPRELEPFLTDEFSADLWTLVEDELLLVLPPFPLHDRSECPAREQLEAFEPGETEPEPEEQQRENPFSVLANLKKKH